MSRRVPYEMPAGLKEAQQRFEEWRGSHSGRRPIPEPLWALAAAQASEHGVFRTAQVLRLDYTKLKQHTRSGAPGGKPRSAQAAFVELLAPPSSAACECVIEIEGPRGRMRIEWKGSTAPDLAGLSRVLGEPGA